MYVSIDLVEEVIERQLRKYKNKLIARHQEGGTFKQEFFEEEPAIDSNDEIQIVRTKKFGIKPMFPEDACVQMELLGHDFFVFSNAETEEVNVVYKRKNGTFGLIRSLISVNNMHNSSGIIPDIKNPGGHSSRIFICPFISA